MNASSRLLLCASLLFATFAVAEDETYRDPASKETLFIAGGPNVSYASLKRSSLRPLKIVDHDDAKRIIKVKFDKSPTVWTLTIDEARTRVVCEADGQPRQVFERIKIDPKGLPGTTAGPGQTVTIKYPKEEASIYDELTEFKGDVAENCDRIEVVSLDAAGEIQARHKLKDFTSGDRTWKYIVAKSRQNMSLGSNRFRVIATFKDGAVALAEIRVSFHEYSGEMAKPVIYLYPPNEQQVSVRVFPHGGVTKSDPLYGSEGWTVRAQPSGKLFTTDGQQHPYLFWESGLTDKPLPLTEGTVVSREKLRGWLVRSLASQGLNETETRDFLEFWWPKMSVKPFAAVRFVPREEIDRAAPLELSPKADTVIRVLIDFRALDAPVKLAPQKLVPASKREGFTAVEWGGLLYR
ncbi:MAG: hypothetical protein JNM17_34975 [Archangium sp.]|nr:hypothetical protein [Archangium sp.]